ncbi:hypothetical protein [Paenibacillus durus]|uniref:Glycosyltransferase RgtA/B/C/D-like domain-containing protein n=1 Tax=Paenibacillus durus TaxID=44251 RepID=A0A089HWH7_PAEDU|nr:hypothetical protein [Paenibacillus durus]AIQ14743.1 hypothetical protein PDUR_24850 [Paenibacillus durus]
MTSLINRTSFFSKYTNYIKIILLILVSRITLSFIGITSRHFLQPSETFKQSLLSTWAQWDGGWYRIIAEHGYDIDHTYNPYFGYQTTYAFYPLYPKLMKYLNFIFHDYIISGIFISTISSIVACVYLYKLSTYYFDQKKSMEVIKYVVFFPASFMLSCVLTESLYLVLVLMCFYYSKKNKWLLVGICGFFLALTRNIGVFIIIPLFIEYLMCKKFKFLEIKYNILFLLFIPCGFVLWGMYLYYLTGDFLMFKNIQVAWERVDSDPISVLYQVFSRGQFQERFWALFTIFAISIQLLSIKKMPIPYSVFTAYSILIPLSTSVISMIRFTLVIFPLYFALVNILKNNFAKTLVVYVMLVLQGLLMVFWSSGYALSF